MAISFDGPTKQITLTTGTVTLSVLDLWSRWVDWWLTDDNSKYGLWFTQIGGEDASIPIYLFQNTNVSIKPQEADHTLAVTAGILFLDGGGDPFMDTTGAFTVRVNYQQPVVAIATDTGGGAGASAQEVWEYDISSTSSGAGKILSRVWAKIKFIVGEL